MHKMRCIVHSPCSAAPLQFMAQETTSKSHLHRLRQRFGALIDCGAQTFDTRFEVTTDR